MRSIIADRYHSTRSRKRKAIYYSGKNQTKKTRMFSKKYVNLDEQCWCKSELLQEFDSLNDI